MHHSPNNNNALIYADCQELYLMNDLCLGE